MNLFPAIKAVGIRMDSSVYSGCYFPTLLKTEMHSAEKFCASVSMQMNLFLATQLQLPYSQRLLINQNCYLNKSAAH